MTSCVRRYTQGLVRVDEWAFLLSDGGSRKTGLHPPPPPRHTHSGIRERRGSRSAHIDLERSGLPGEISYCRISILLQRTEDWKVEESEE
jgi:hypothetical protein